MIKRGVIKRGALKRGAATSRVTKGCVVKGRVTKGCTTFLLSLCGAASLKVIGCVERVEPPGAEPRPVARPLRVQVATKSNATSDEAATSSSVRNIGTIDDNLPFKPDGTKIASIAWRTWIYTDTGPRRTRFGYLRAGAIVDARGPEIRNEGCDGGWYRINPRGFVCLGLGATKDLNHPVVVQSAVRAKRANGLPYVYAMAAETAPHLYFTLPSEEQMRTVEGSNYKQRALLWRQRSLKNGVRELLGPSAPPPEFLKPGVTLAKPYGAKKRLHYSVHAGQASPDSGFAIQRVFEWGGREFGLTTELDLIALDRTKVVKPSAFHGVELSQGEALPVAFVEQRYAPSYELEQGVPRATGQFGFREGLKLTGQQLRGGFLEAKGGRWFVESTARIIKPRDSFPSFATGSRKWIDISIRQQSLVAYVGQKPVYATLVSTGRGGLGDPEKGFATVRGTFMIYYKSVSSTMDGDEDKSDSYALLDVPFVQYFHKGYALHGTYWHDEFGKIRSHGCVNLAPIDSAWLFEWTDPPVPKHWHGVLNKQRGTVVYIHP